VARLASAGFQLGPERTSAHRESHFKNCFCFSSVKNCLSSLVTDKLFTAILDKSIRAQAFWQEIANNKTQITNNNQIQNINDQKIAYL